jgi:tRNA(fMet)-specific endonuclease VapC
MNLYLLDTSICVFLFRQKYGIAEKLSALSPSQCYISEVTIAELKYGAYKSNRTEDNLRLVDQLVSEVNVVPFAESIEFFAKEKTRLRAMGGGPLWRTLIC